MAEELIALFEGKEIGRIFYRSGRLSFHYAAEWRDSPGSFPLSLSMPLGAAEHGHAHIHSFLLGLLPDSEQVLERWGSRFHVSPRNPFALLAHVGADCAGAVQFFPQDRIPKLQAQAKESIQWLTEHDVAERLRELRRDHSAWRLQNDAGQFSLAGAQPKTALLLRNRRWGLPYGRTPSTHIVKPPLAEWDGHAENEHFCLELAARTGLIACKSLVQQFEDQTAIVIERYDRSVRGDGIDRRHQEDLCQALGVPPARKYQNEGGPSIRNIADLLQAESSRPAEDLLRFLDAIAFNWIVAGTDAHAKNYSVLLGTDRAVRLAPLYDVASILPYPGVQIPKLKMAMKIGGEYYLRKIGMRQWRKLANEVRVNEDEIVQKIRVMTAKIPDLAATLGNKVLAEGLTHPLISRLAAVIQKRAQDCARILET